MQKILVVCFLAAAVLLSTSSAKSIDFQEMKDKLAKMSPEAQAAAKKMQAEILGLIDKTLGGLPESVQAELKTLMPEMPK